MSLNRFRTAVVAACLFIGAVPALAQTAQRDLAKEEANRRLVLEFYDQFFNRHEVDKAADAVADNYKQHNPNVPDGKAPLVSFFTGRFRDNPQSRNHVERSATDGDLVYLHVHATNGPDDRGRAIVDIFRVTDGKIVEHWDVIENVPEKSANPNTMF